MNNSWVEVELRALGRFEEAVRLTAEITAEAYRQSPWMEGLVPGEELRSGVLTIVSGAILWRVRAESVVAEKPVASDARAVEAYVRRYGEHDGLRAVVLQDLGRIEARVATAAGPEVSAPLQVLRAGCLRILQWPFGS